VERTTGFEEFRIARTKMMYEMPGQ